MSSREHPGNSGPVHWIPALTVAGAIAWFSHQPDWPEAAVGQPDWLLHGVAFGTLALCVLWGMTRGMRSWPPGAGQLLAAFLLTSLYGALDEIHQSFVPGRHAAVTDWLADTAGAAAALAGAAAIFAGFRGVWENRRHR